MATTWSTTDKQQNTLSNGNLTATATAGGFSSGRTNVSWSSGKIYLEIRLGSSSSGTNPFSSAFSADFGSGAFVPINNSMLIGIANASWNLFAELGQSTPSNSVGVAVGNFDEVYVNNTFFSGGVHPCVVGDTVSMAVDYGAGRFWYSTDQMQTDIGAGAWNNSLTDNPATGTGGLDFSSQTKPFFGAWYSPAVGNSATINAHSPWHRAIPSGFTPADSNTITGAISVTQALQTAGTGPNPFSTDFSIDFGNGVGFRGVVIVGGVISVTQAPQTMVATGTASLVTRTGAISATQAAQSMVGTATTAFPVFFGPIVASQAAQSMVGTGTVTTVARVGAISATQAAQTMAGFGFVGSVSLPILVWVD